MFSLGYKIAKQTTLKPFKFYLVTTTEITHKLPDTQSDAMIDIIAL